LARAPRGRSALRTMGQKRVVPPPQFSGGKGKSNNFTPSKRDYFVRKKKKIFLRLSRSFPGTAAHFQGDCFALQQKKKEPTDAISHSRGFPHRAQKRVDSKIRHEGEPILQRKKESRHAGLASSLVSPNQKKKGDLPRRTESYRRKDCLPGPSTRGNQFLGVLQMEQFFEGGSGSKDTA